MWKNTNNCRIVMKNIVLHVISSVYVFRHENCFSVYFLFYSSWVAQKHKPILYRKKPQGKMAFMKWVWVGWLYVWKKKWPTKKHSTSYHKTTLHPASSVLPRDLTFFFLLIIIIHLYTEKCREVHIFTFRIHYIQLKA